MNVARDVLISANPLAGSHSRRELVEALIVRLKELAFVPLLVPDIVQLEDLAAQKLEAGTLRAIVAAGGDGTVSLVANRTPAGAPLVVMPLGTENLLAKYVGLTADPRQVAQVVLGGACVRLDAGLAANRIFTLMAGCGFDAEVVRRLHKGRTGHIRHLSYAKPILDAIRNYHYPELQVHYADADSPDADALTQHLTARWVFVVNLPRYAGGLSFAPHASGTDGLLDVCTFKEGSLWNGLLYLSGVMLGQHEGMEDFACIRTRRLRIESSEPAPFQLDGDPGGEVPVEIRALPGRITMLVPHAWAAQHGQTDPETSMTEDLT
jgi:diacylglycerol kinase family enzyme